MTKIAVYGASGMIGGRMAAEALARGREVIAIIRSGGRLPAEVRGLVALVEIQCSGAAARVTHGRLIASPCPCDRACRRS